MAVSTKAIRVGVIAEEKNDVEVLYEYTAKLNDRARISCTTGTGENAL
jgi:hypothetical protein